MLDLNNKNVMECIRFLNTVLNKDSNIFLAVSGGSDSILIYNLVKDFVNTTIGFSKKQINVLHFNHKTRAQTDEEEQILKHLCEKDGINITIGTNTVITHNEKTLRKQRYEFFEKNMLNSSNCILILGHNLDDRIETSFLNMMRGCGVDGFLNMSKIDQKISEIAGNEFKYTVLRPLLDLTKNEINQICLENNISYFVDYTNFDENISKRNKLRKTITSIVHESNYDRELSHFYKSFSNIYKSFTRQLQTLLYKEIFISNYLSYKKAYKFEKNDLTLDEIKNFLYEVGGFKDISKNFLNDLYQFLTNSKGGFIFKNGLNFVKSHKNIYILVGEKEFWIKPNTLHYPIESIGQLIENKDFKILIEKKERIGGEIRYFHKNDIYKDNKLSKYFINKKIPIFYRNIIPLVVKDGKVLEILNIQKVDL